MKNPFEYSFKIKEFNLGFPHFIQNTPYLIRSLKNAKRMRKDRMESLNHFDFMIHPQLQRVMKRTLKRIKQFEED